MVKGYTVEFCRESSHLLPPAHVIAAASVGENYGWVRIITVRFVVKLDSVYRRFGHSGPPLGSGLDESG